jgi:protein tyrosine phosphatase (PTP) superfamily phosphohydrolase (DUF442 family)
MKPGSLFRFAAGKPTGYEVPFGEPAFLLIFKGDRLTRSEEEFIGYLRGMARKLEEENRSGVPFRLADLPADHPARVFAREVSPEFERGLPSRTYPFKLPGKPVLENLIQVSNRIFSGGEPAGEAAFEALAGMGIRTIVSVDGARPDLDAARRHGLRYVHIPIGYGGIGEKAAQCLTRAARDVEGPIYVHCHHGKHRGPAAAAILRRAADGIAGPEARKLLELAGTSLSYPGLWRDVEAYAAPGPDVALPPLVESAEVRSMAGAMSRIDRSHDNLVLSSDAKWGVPEGHPDIAAPQEASILEDAFRDAVRFARDGEDAALEALLVEALRTSTALRESLESRRLEDATRHWKDVRAGCEPCHKKYRN